MAGRLGVPSTLRGGGGAGFGGTATRRWLPRWSRVWLCLGAVALDLLLWGGDGSLRWGGTAPTWAVVVSALALFLVLADERRTLPAGFVLAWCYTLTWGVVLPHYQPFTAVMLALHEAARRLPTPQARPYLVAVAAPWLLNTANTTALTGAGAAGAAVTTGLWAVMTALVWLAGRVTFRNAELLRLRDEAFSVRLQLARQQDRVALARELHDVLSHTIGAVSMQAAGARALSAGDPRIPAALDHITAASTSAMQELRRLLGFLAETPDAAQASGAAGASGGVTAPREGDRRSVDLPQRLGALIDTTRACGLRVRVDGLETSRGLAPPVAQVVLRVVQESLANALRHQGRGCRVEVSLHTDSESVTVRVRSVGGAGRDAALSGHGFGMGLRGVADRVAQIGGEVETSGSAEHFRVRVRLPRDGDATTSSSR